MRIELDNNKRSIGFNDIRQATVFTYKDKIYLKCEGDKAVDLANGDIYHPETEWVECYIYPQASLRLGNGWKGNV